MSSRTPKALHSEAVNAIAKFLGDDQKIVVLGGSGWLGRTLSLMLLEIGIEHKLFGSYSREMVVAGQSVHVHETKFSSIQEFEPTFLVDFSFLTKKHIPKLGLTTYLKENTALINMALRVFSLDSISRGIFTSSGASIFPIDALDQAVTVNPYGFLKRRMELEVQEASVALNKTALVIRPWSLSGALNPDPDSYAFSSIIKQSFSGSIHLEATKNVLRRYVACEDFLAMSMARVFSMDSRFEVFDSGGELTSVLELAHLVKEHSRIKCSISHYVDRSNAPDNYYSNNESWLAACREFRFNPESLVMQVERNLEYLFEN